MSNQVTEKRSMDAGSDRPLVTFALFAYNQEAFIHEAIESALAQTYEPLEIILSDDCSSDRTFKIMQEMAGAYRGPHSVCVRKSALNAGTARHVQEVFDVSSGKLFVVASGDDISLPGRVSALFSAWDSAGRPPGVVHSGWEVFRNGEGASFGRFQPKKSEFGPNLLEGYARSQWLPAAAPTVAYTRDVFNRFEPLLGGSIIEDAPLFLRAALVGRFVPCYEPLVRIRSHDNNTGTGYTFGAAGRWNRFMQSKLIAFRNMQADLARWDGSINEALRIRIERRILAVLRSVSGLMLPETSRIGILQKLAFCFRMVLAPAVAPKFRLRVEYALSFFGIQFHARIKNSLRHLFKVRGGHAEAHSQKDSSPLA